MWQCFSKACEIMEPLKLWMVTLTIQILPCQEGNPKVKSQINIKTKPWTPCKNHESSLRLGGRWAAIIRVVHSSGTLLVSYLALRFQNVTEILHPRKNNSKKYQKIIPAGHLKAILFGILFGPRILASSCFSKFHGVRSQSQVAYPRSTSSSWSPETADKVGRERSARCTGRRRRST